MCVYVRVYMTHEFTSFLLAKGREEQCQLACDACQQNNSNATDLPRFSQKVTRGPECTAGAGQHGLGETKPAVIQVQAEKQGQVGKYVLSQIKASELPPLLKCGDSGWESTSSPRGFPAHGRRHTVCLTWGQPSAEVSEPHPGYL